MIQAYIDFARRWNITASSVICASTGVAAMQIRGCTLHSALAIQRNLNPSNPKPDHITAWSEIGLVIVDEFSMISADLYDLMDSRLRKLKDRSDTPFGGVNMIFSGDFYQLPPIGTKLIGFRAGISGHDYTTNASTMRARESWATVLTDVIELTQNMRQLDPVLAGILERLRINQPTAEDLTILNTRFTNNELCAQSNDHQPPPGTVAAVAVNQAREQALQLCITQMLLEQPNIENEEKAWRSRGILLVQARVKRAAKNAVNSKNQNNYIRSLPTKRLGAVGNLFCIIGAHYLVGNNTDVGKGVANGTLSILQDVILRSSANIRIININEAIQVHAVYADEVYAAIYRHEKPGWRERSIFNTLPLGCFPVIPRQHTIICTLGKHRTQRLGVKIEQLPCDLAMCLTGHKFQGQTNQQIILGSMGNRYRNGTDGWLYVVCARVTKLSGLYLTEKLNPDPKFYKPRYEVMAEMDRLRKLQEVTTLRLSMASINDTP